jgi:hypothetical protein
MLQRQMSDWLKVSCHGAAYENEHKKTRRLTCLVLCLIAALGSGAAAQTSGPTVTRQSEANVPARLVLREGVGRAYPGWEAGIRGLVCGLVRRASPPCSLASSGGKTAAARPGLWTIHLLLGFGRPRVVGWSRATTQPRAPIRRENRGSSSTDSRADHRVVGELHASPGGQRLLWCRRICRRRRRTPTSCRNGQRS